MDLVFKVGDEASTFFYILSGKVQIQVKQDAEVKMSKGIDEGEVFGFS